MSSLITMTELQLLKLEEFKEFCNNKFKNDDGSNKFCYSNVVFKNDETNVIIICLIHGEFKMTPYKHKNSDYGCKECERNDMYISKLKTKFGEKFDYSKVVYKGRTKDIIVICKEHTYEFKINAGYLLTYKFGCRHCILDNDKKLAEQRRWTVPEWIEKAKEIHPEKKDNYTKIRFETINKELWVHDIFCNIHQLLYSQRATDHHGGHRCSKCGKDTLSDLYRLPYNELIQRCKELHEEEKYEYDEKEPEDYRNGNSPIPVKCPEHGHGIWHPSAHNHINGSKCPSCLNKTEQKLYKLLSQNYPMLERQYKVDWCKNISYLPFDFVLKLLKIIIELDGPQHFIQIMDWKSPEETRSGDLYKMKCANDNGFSVIRILQEDVYYDRYDWLNVLDITINKIIEEQVVQNIYLCKNNEYEHFNPI